MAGGGGRSKAEASLANLTQRGILGAGPGPGGSPTARPGATSAAGPGATSAAGPGAAAAAGSGAPGAGRPGMRPEPGPRTGPGRSPAPGPRHCWVDDPPGFAGRWPGVVVEWRRGHSGWQGRTLVVVVLGGDEPLVLELWLDARHLTAA